MGKMALGYGSEFHLLRWLGRHRQLFTKKVCEAANTADKMKNWTDIDWRDFGFADGGLVPDLELCGIEFLLEADRPVVENEFTNGQYKWPRVNRKFLMNWDVVGIANDGTYILVEAKAHTEEIGGKCSAGKDSKEIIKKAMELPKGKDCFNVSESEKKDWLGKYYQLANRLYMVSLLELCGLKAVFLYVLFTGDRFPGRAKATCPTEKDGEAVWRKVLDDEYKALGLVKKSTYFEKHVIELPLPVVDSQEKTDDREDSGAGQPS